MAGDEVPKRRSLTELRAEFEQRQAQDEVKNLDPTEIQETLDMNARIRDMLTTDDPTQRAAKLDGITQDFYNRFTNEGQGMNGDNGAHDFVALVEVMYEGEWADLLDDQNLSPAEMIGIWSDISHTMAGASGTTLEPDAHPLAKAIAERAMERAGVAADNDHVLSGFTRNIHLALEGIKDDVDALKVLGETPADTPVFDQDLPVENLDLSTPTFAR